MKVLVLAPCRFDTAPSQRFRIEQWMPLLQREGVRFEFDAFMSVVLHDLLYRPGHILSKAAYLVRDFFRRLATSLRARRYDAIYLHREAAIIGPACIERLLSWSGVPLVYEFDDAIYVRYVSPANKYFSYLKCPQKTATICRLARHVVVGNDVLSQYALQYNPHVTIVPTTIDVEKYVPQCRYDFAGEPVIGWSGSYSSIAYLEVLKPAFERLAEKFSFRLEVIGATSFNMDKVSVRSQNWCSATEVEDLARIDIGVMPLPDADWARGKCALKALQYMALGIPTVVSPVGVNKQVIQHEVNGLHASTMDEWVETLARLIDDAALRRHLGEAGRQTVETEYSAQVHAPRVLSVLDSVINKA